MIVINTDMWRHDWDESTGKGRLVDKINLQEIYLYSSLEIHLNHIQNLLPNMSLNDIICQLWCGFVNNGLTVGDL